MNIKANIIFLLSLWALATPLMVSAQGRHKGVEKSAITEVSAIVTDERGVPVDGATIWVNEGKDLTKSDENGHFVIEVISGASFMIEADGFESYVSNPNTDNIKSSFVLAKAPVYAGERDRINLPNGITNLNRYSVGAVGKVGGDEIESYSDALVSNMLQGKVAGLSAIMGIGGLSNNSSTLTIRGNSANDTNDALVLVDGIPRSLDNILPSEIESIEVLKDATSKIIYGAKATNGVVLVTTKKGAANKRIIKVNVDMGVGAATNYPEYLDSYNYATLYNEARVNDGLTPIYSDADLAGYAASSGAYDFRYPNVDYYDYFLKSSLSYKRADVEFSGGNDAIRYSMVAGYTGKGGLQSVGDNTGMTRINVRGNLSVQINKVISSYIGIAAVLQNIKSGYVNDGNTFSRLSTIRPNEYPLIISPDIIAVESNGYPALGASLSDSYNLYGDMMYGGSINTQNTSGLMNLGFNFDLDFLTKGLSAKASMSLDNYFSGQESLTTNAPTYAQLWTSDDEGNESVTLLQRRTSSVTDQEKLSSTSTYRNTSWSGGVDYLRTFDDMHRVTANALAYYYVGESTGVTQNDQTANFLLRGNYVYNDRYIVEASGAVMGSSRFTGRNRFLPTGAAGLGWIVSEENFLSDVKWLNYLKLKASAGVLGFDGSTGYFLTRNTWTDTSTVRLNSDLAPDVNMYNTVGNDELKWERTVEYNIGFETLVFDNRLAVEANYFNECRKDIIMTMSSQYSEVYGTIYGQDNWGEVRNQGFDLSASWRDRVSDLSYSIGFNALYSKNNYIKCDEVDYVDDYVGQRGNPTDALYGYVALGLFGKDVELEGAPHQTLGEYGVGDIAYADLNNDGVVDSNDRTCLGNSYPEFQLALDLDMSYKGFGLYLLFTSQLGGDKFLNNSYYWVSGDDKYSAEVSNRYHPQNNPTGSYPSLSTTGSPNNFTNSTFWLQNTSFLRLKSVEFSYTFGRERPITNWLRSVKVYARATNLWCISGVDSGLDPELLNAGVTNYPVLTTITGGVNISF